MLQNRASPPTEAERGELPGTSILRPRPRSPGPVEVAQSSSRRLLRYLIWIWISCLVFGSLLPFGIKVKIGTTSQLHRPLHIVAFGLTAFLLLVLSTTYRQKITAIVFVFALAFGLELVEWLVNYHPTYSAFEWRDVLDDSYGIATAAILTGLLRRRWR